VASEAAIVAKSEVVACADVHAMMNYLSPMRNETLISAMCKIQICEAALPASGIFNFRGCMLLSDTIFVA
jgi:hypothetical protein